MIRIVVANDYPVVRHGVRALLEVDPEFRIVGEADSVPQTVALLEEFQPDVLISDLVIHGLNMLEVTRQIIKRWPNVHVVIMTTAADEHTVQEALTSGVLGFLLGESTAVELQQAVQDVIARRYYLSAPLLERAIDAFVRGVQQQPPTQHDMLTSREREVLKLAAQGLNNVDIADQLLFSRRTVEAHRASLMRKLGLRTQTELVRFALQHGILSSDQ